MFFGEYGSLLKIITAIIIIIIYIIIDLIFLLYYTKKGYGLSSTSGAIQFMVPITIKIINYRTQVNE